jgi:hypothetical protein
VLWGLCTQLGNTTAEAYRPDEDSPAGVKIHLELTRWEVDVDPVLTSDEARRLAAALLTAADQTDGTEFEALGS